MMDDKQYKLEESINVNETGRKKRENSLDNIPLDEDFNSIKARRNFKVIIGNKQTVNKKNTRYTKRNKAMSKSRTRNNRYSNEEKNNFMSLFYMIWSRIKNFIRNLL